MADHLEAAIRAGAAAIKAPIIFHERGHYEAYAEAVLTAATPALERHFAQDPNVRRAIIQELAGEAERFRDCSGDTRCLNWLRDMAREAES